MQIVTSESDCTNLTFIAKVPEEYCSLDRRLRQSRSAITTVADKRCLCQEMQKHLWDSDNVWSWVAVSSGTGHLAAIDETTQLYQCSPNNDSKSTNTTLTMIWIWFKEACKKETSCIFGEILWDFFSISLWDLHNNNSNLTIPKTKSHRTNNNKC